MTLDLRAAGLVIMLALFMPTDAAHAQQREYYDTRTGKSIGRSITGSDGSTTVYEANGKMIGRTSTDTRGSTTFYGADGRKAGSVTPQQKGEAVMHIGRESLKGLVPESWHCVDCGMDTAPGILNRADMEKAIAALGEKWHTNEAGVEQSIDERAEVYTVREKVWAEAGMQAMAGCLCIGCLEKRMGRQLRSKEFQRGQPLNATPGTPRLLKRRRQR